MNRERRTAVRISRGQAPKSSPTVCSERQLRSCGRRQPCALAVVGNVAEVAIRDGGPNVDLTTERGRVGAVVDTNGCSQPAIERYVPAAARRRARVY